MVKLKPMPESYFARFVEEAVERYARDTVISGRWRADEAAARSLAELEGFLPSGVNTPGHDVCLIECDGIGEAVGTIWYGPAVRDQLSIAYVYDLCIYPAYRRRGFAASSLGEVESISRRRKLGAIALHVFEHNQPAQALYRKLGFKPLEGLMLKGLDDAVDSTFDRKAMQRTTVLESRLTCPHCGFASTEVMPTNACMYFHRCGGCQALLTPKAGDCCVFCSYGTVPCPPVQEDRACCSSPEAQ